MHITANARKMISKFKNIPNNPLIYSDTDSVFLPKELDSIFIGKNLGEMKLENIITKGIFLGKKLYAYRNIQNEVIIASAGINSELLNWTDFENLILGKDVVKHINKFFVNPEEGNVFIDNQFKFTIKGVPNNTPIQMHINSPPV